jgi:hypothetical protein
MTPRSNREVCAGETQRNRAFRETVVVPDPAEVLREKTDHRLCGLRRIRKKSRRFEGCVQDWRTRGQLEKTSATLIGVHALPHKQQG